MNEVLTLMMRRSVLLIFSLLVFSDCMHAGPPSESPKQFLLGFNQAWIANAYSSYLTDNFDEIEINRTFALAKKSGARLLRFWLFEGTNPGGFIWEGDRPSGLKPQFLSNVRKLIHIAHQHQIQLNLTFFDGNISTWKSSVFTPVQKNWWYNLLNEKFRVGEDFRSKVLGPLFEVLDEPLSRQVVTHLDLANEINAMAFSMWTNGVRFADGWNTANAFICRYYQYIKADPRVSSIPITASIGWWQGERILNEQPWSSCVDYYSFHVYDNDGDIADCKKLADFAHAKGKKIYLGEFGQYSTTKFSDELQAKTTRKFLWNAYTCGLDGAWPWRLAHSNNADPLHFEKNNVPRPALEVFRGFALNLKSIGAW